MTLAQEPNPLEPQITAARVHWMSVLSFTILACGLAWIVALPLWLNGGLTNPFTFWIIAVMMFTPTLATLLVMFVGKTPRGARARFLGITPLRPLRRTLGMSLVAIGGTFAIVGVIILLSAAFGLVKLDLVNFSGFAETLKASRPEGSVPGNIQALVWTQLLLLPVTAIVNSFLSFGEELGWRGWLVPALAPLGIWPTLIISGAIWGIWHAPIILLGYNFRRTDVAGLLFMVGGCVAWGILLGWLRLRTKSMWPAVFAHGALNAVGGVLLFLVASGQNVDLAIVGPLGVMSWVVVAIVIGILAATGQFRRSLLALPSAPAESASQRARRAR